MRFFTITKTNERIDKSDLSKRFDDLINLSIKSNKWRVIKRFLNKLTIDE